jgi:hypothetical protein
MKRKKLTRKSLDKYFKILDIADTEHDCYVQAIEDVMKKETGIPDIEFVHVDGCIVGIGSSSNPVGMRLIHRR